MSVIQLFVSVAIMMFAKAIQVRMDLYRKEALGVVAPLSGQENYSVAVLQPSSDSVFPFSNLFLKLLLLMRTRL